MVRATRKRPMMEAEYTGIAGVAIRFGYDPNTIMGFVTSGVIPAYRLTERSELRFKISELDALMTRVSTGEAGQ